MTEEKIQKRWLRPAQYEAIGVAIILLAAFLEVTVLRQSLSAAGRGPIIAINEELKMIWTGLAYNGQEYVTKNFSRFYEWAKIIDDAGENDVFLTGPLSMVRFVLFAVGSLLTIYGKWTAGSR